MSQTSFEYRKLRHLVSRVAGLFVFKQKPPARFDGWLLPEYLLWRATSMNGYSGTWHYYAPFGTKHDWNVLYFVKEGCTCPIPLWVTRLRSVSPQGDLFEVPYRASSSVFSSKTSLPILHVVIVMYFTHCLAMHNRLV